MTFTYSGTDYELPNTLADITLEKRIEFENLYGRDINDRILLVDAIQDPSEKSVEEFLLLADTACKTLAFFANIDLEDVRERMEVRHVINVYTANLQVLLTEEYQLEEQEFYNFDGDRWIIAPPAEEATNESMSYSTFLFMKSIVYALASLGDGEWGELPSLCALYLRKEGETLDDVKAAFDERKTRMLQLPLDIALTVGNYLKDTMLLYLDTIKNYKPETPEP